MRRVFQNRRGRRKRL